jgi:hypothetical protein
MVRHFGGVPLLLNGTLKAGGLKADWFDSQIKPEAGRVLEFCHDYHIHVMLCRRKGRWSAPCPTFAATRSKADASSLTGENAFISQWEENVADKTQSRHDLQTGRRAL